MPNSSEPRLTPRPWMVLPIAIVAAAIVGPLVGRGSAFLVVAGGVLLLAIWVFWESLQNLTGDAPLTLEEAIGLGAPSAEEERKRSVLRTLKDLEYERSVGKISEEDYKELSSKYRAEAKELLQLLDSSMGPARERAEQLLQQRLKDGPPADDAPADDAPADDTPAGDTPTDSEPPEAKPTEAEAESKAEAEAESEAEAEAESKAEAEAESETRTEDSTPEPQSEPEADSKPEGSDDNEGKS